MYGLKRERRRAGMSAAKLAERLGVSRQAVHAWEAGTYWPKAENLPGIAAALGCRVEDLFREDEEAEHGAY